MSLYQQRRQAGLCPTCGERRQSAQYIRCFVCRVKECQRKAAKRDRRRQQGQCVRCLTPALPGMTVCAAHTVGLSPWAPGTSVLLQPLAVREAAATVVDSLDHNPFFDL